MKLRTERLHRTRMLLSKTVPWDIPLSYFLLFEMAQSRKETIQKYNNKQIMNHFLPVAATTSFMLQMAGQVYQPWTQPWIAMDSSYLILEPIIASQSAINPLLSLCVEAHHLSFILFILSSICSNTYKILHLTAYSSTRSLCVFVYH